MAVCRDRGPVQNYSGIFSHRFFRSFSTAGRVVYSISPRDSRWGQSGPWPARYPPDHCTASGPGEGRVIEHVRGADQFAVIDLEPEADDPGGPSNRVQFASQRPHRHGRGLVRSPHPAGHEDRVQNGSSASPTAGKPLWERTIITGSSLPTYLPAIQRSGAGSLLEAAIPRHA